MDGAIRIEGADLAEPFDVAGTDEIVPGMVVAIDPAHPGQLRVADKAYDRTVAGCVSGAGQSEWRGKVQHVLSGETHYFRDWPTLLTHLQAMLPATDSEREAGGGESTTSDQ